MKTYMTAEQFEEEVAKLQLRCDNVVNRVNTFLTRRVKELHDQMNDDQKERVVRRLKAKIMEQQKRIISPGSHRFN